MTKTVRIGGASAFSFDSVSAAAQLLRAEPCPNYLMFDFMSEGTIGTLARAFQANPETAYLSELISVHLEPNLLDIMAKGVKIIANAGGMNPQACGKAVRECLAARGVDLKVAVVSGDNILDRAGALREAGLREMFSGAAFPETVASVNVYLGAFPIARALDAGADIVITGRCADSALGLGPLIHEFGWRQDDWDRLAAGTLVGHLLECGCQVTGGTFTDWEDVPGWEDVGYPIADVTADGACVISKPAGTGGLVSVGSVAEQLLYEVADPQAYIVADVVCDFSGVVLTQLGENQVAVAGARGYPATLSYKAVASFDGGWRGTYAQVIIGIDAARKAERQGRALIERGRRLLRGRNLGEYLREDVDAVGAEGVYGARGQSASREVYLRASVDHQEKLGVELFCREALASTSAMAPGSTATVQVNITPISKLFMFLLPKQEIAVSVELDAHDEAVPTSPGVTFDPSRLVRRVPPAAPIDAQDQVPLIRLAWARSGDKGNLFNIAVIARRADYLPYIRAALTPARVGDWFAHLLPAGAAPRVDAYEAPGFHALNFVVHDALDGGILASPRVDSAAKGMAQQLLEIMVPVPRGLVATDN